MTNATFDTSGVVQLPLGTLVWWDEAPSHHGLSPFAQGYVSAAFRGGVSIAGEGGLMHVLSSDRAVGYSSLSGTALKRILNDVSDYRKAIGAQAAALTAVDGEQFWVRRQAGEWPDAFPPITLYVTESGAVQIASAP